MQPYEDSSALPRGTRIHFRSIKGLADVPLSISTIRDSCLCQRTNEAWTAASCLFAALKYLESFHIAQDENDPLRTGGIAGALKAFPRVAPVNLRGEAS